MIGGDAGGASPFKMLVSMVGAKAVDTALTNLSANPECIDRVGEALYRDAQEPNTPPWTALPVKEKRQWTSMAAAAIRAARDHILARPR